MKKVFSFVVLLLLVARGFSQVIKTVPFDLGGQIEPSFVPKLVQDGSYLYSVARVKGKPNKDTDYLVVCRNDELTVLWSQVYHNLHNSEITHFEVNGDEVRLFTNSYDKEIASSYLIMDRWQKNSGLKRSRDTVSENKILPWQIKKNKGKVKQTFEGALLSIQYSKYTTPLEYKIELSESPNKKIFLTYIYDYSRSKLYLKTKLYNKDLTLLKEGEIPVDNDYISYGLNVSDEGKIIIYKANKTGRAIAIRYDLADSSFRYVGLYTANSTRDNLTIVQQDSSHLYMAKLNRKNESFVGLTYSKFNFQEEKIDETRYQPIAQEFKNEVLRQMKENKIPNVDKDWYHYELTDFFIDADSNKVVLIEERNVVSNHFNYSPEGVEDIGNWSPQEGRLKAGNLLVVAFDKENKLLSLHNFLKNQEIDATDGLNTVSYYLIHKGSTLQLIMSHARNGGALNEIQHINFDYVNDKLISKRLLNNPDRLVLTRSYITHEDNNLYFVGRKGVLGSKTFLVKYKL